MMVMVTDDGNDEHDVDCKSGRFFPRGGDAKHRHSRLARRGAKCRSSHASLTPLSVFRLAPVLLPLRLSPLFFFGGLFCSPIMVSVFDRNSQL